MNPIALHLSLVLVTLLAGTQAEVARLNLLAQEARRQAGELNGEPIEVGNDRFYLNDRVLLLRNHVGLGIFNGELATLAQCEGTVLSLIMDDGRQVRIDPAEYPHLRLGYALTTHRAQGMTAEESFVQAGIMQSRELTYVQASRARGNTHFYLAGEPLEEAARRMSHSRPKEFAHEILDQTAPSLALELSL